MNLISRSKDKLCLQIYIMHQCRVCGEEVFPSGDFVHCEVCGAEYQCLVLEEHYEEVSVSYVATQSQSMVLSQQEIEEKETEKLLAAEDAKSTETMRILKFVLEDLSNISDVCLPSDFKDKCIELYQSIADVFFRDTNSRSRTPSVGEESINFLDSPDENTDRLSGEPSRSRRSSLKKYLMPSDIIAVLWLSMRITMEEPCTILMSDLIRWVKELHIFFAKLHGPRTSYLVRSYYKRLSMFFTSQHLQVERVPPPDVKIIIKRICADMELPCSVGRAVWAYYRKQYGHPLGEALRQRRQYVMVHYELRIAASFVAVLKLHFGLNGQSELKLDSLAKQLNRKFDGETEWKPLFEFKEWLEYVVWRSSVLQHVYYPSQMSQGMNLVANDLSPLYHYRKQREKRSSEFQGIDFDEDQYSKTDEKFGPAFAFSPSLSPAASRDKEFRIRYASLNECERKRLKLGGLKPPPCFRQKSARHVSEPDKFVEEMKKRGIRLTKCPSFTGKVYFAQSLRAEELDLPFFNDLRRSRSYYYPDPGRVLCDVRNISDVEAEVTDSETYELPTGYQPLFLFSTPKYGNECVNEWSRDIRQLLPQSLASVVELLAETFELSELELMAEVNRLEKKYCDNEIFGIAVRN